MVWHIEDEDGVGKYRARCWHTNELGSLAEGCHMDHQELPRGNDEVVAALTWRKESGPLYVYVAGYPRRTLESCSCTRAIDVTLACEAEILKNDIAWQV